MRGLQRERQPFSALDGVNNREQRVQGREKTGLERKGFTRKRTRREHKEEVHVFSLLYANIIKMHIDLLKYR